MTQSRTALALLSRGISGGLEFRLPPTAAPDPIRMVDHSGVLNTSSRRADYETVIEEWFRRLADGRRGSTRCSQSRRATPMS